MEVGVSYLRGENFGECPSKQTSKKGWICCCTKITYKMSGMKNKLFHSWTIKIDPSSPNLDD
jgi:hypothetical protein